MNKEIFNTNNIIISIVSLFSGVLLASLFPKHFLLKLKKSINKDEKTIENKDNKDNKEKGENKNDDENDEDEEEEEDYDEDYDEEDDGNDIEYDEEIGDCKQVLIIRTDLGMTKGKIIAQCCHASLGARQKALKEQKKVLRQWENFGCAKITLKANSKEELIELRNAAKEVGIVNYLVLDSGFTQIPSGSATVLAIGPAPRSKVDEVSKHLKLY